MAVSSTIEMPDAVLDRITAFCEKVLKTMNKADWELSVLLCDDPHITELNSRYRNLNSPTDVLSFPQDDRFTEHDRVYIGDVVISIDTARSQALENGLSLDHELHRLLVHGILHLAGMVHDSDEEYDEMMHRQETLVSMFDGEQIF